MTLKVLPKLKKQGALKTPSKKRQSFRAELGIRTKISPKLGWMFPYLKKAKSKMPSLVLPRQIRPYKPIKSKIMRVLGNVYFANKMIVIATHTQQTYLNKKGKLRVKKVIRLPKSKMLDTLAHELAHFRYQDHGYEHEEYTRIIFRTFDLKEKCPHCKGSGKVDLEPKP